MHTHPYIYIYTNTQGYVDMHTHTYLIAKTNYSGQYTNILLLNDRHTHYIQSSQGQYLNIKPTVEKICEKI